MTLLGQASTPFETRIEAAIARWPAWRGRPLRYALAVPPVASPVHRAVTSDCVRIEIEREAAVFLKIRHDDMATDIVPWAAEAATKAAALGVGPDVLVATDGLLGLTDLAAPWRTATVGDLQDHAVTRRVLDAKRRLHDDRPLGRRFCPFDRIDTLALEARAAKASVPDDMTRLLAAARLIRTATEAAGADLRFCHNEGAASNIMLNGPDVRLVDFDSAGDNDPWFDIAVVLNEAFVFDNDRRAAIEHVAGRCDERVFNRCRLYGAVDDLLWGLWGTTRAATSARPGIEFFKYGQWRLLHARTTMNAWDFETWLRRL